MILNRLKTPRKSITSIQRDGQARSPTKSEWDSANAQPYKHTDDCSMKSEWDSAFRGIVRFWEGWFGRKGGGAFERVVGMARFDVAILQSCDR